MKIQAEHKDAALKILSGSMDLFINGPCAGCGEAHAELSEAEALDILKDTIQRFEKEGIDTNTTMSTAMAAILLYITLELDKNEC